MSNARAPIDIHALHTKRLKSLWRIVTAPNLGGHELTKAMLSEGAEVMRPGQVFAGTLGHIEGDDYVLDVVSAQLVDSFVLKLLPDRIKRADTLHVRDLTVARTQSWDDCQAVPDLPEGPRRAGLRSQITTQFTASGLRYVLTFGSIEEPSTIPFGVEDNDYVEVLASILARHLEREQHLTSLREATRRSRHHAERLAQLLKITNDSDRSDERLISAALRHAAGAIRPGQAFHGAVARLGDGAGSPVVLACETNVGAPAFPVGTRLSPDIIVRGIDRTQIQNDASDRAWRAVITTKFDAGTSTYVLLFASAQPVTTTFGAEDRTYMDILVLHFANVLKLGDLQSSLDDEIELSMRQAERLTALKSITTDPQLPDKQTLLMLEQSAAVIRPGQEFRAILWRVTGETAIAESIVMPPTFAGDPYVVGSTVVLAQTALTAVLDTEHATRAWDDMQAVDDMDGIAARYNTRALIIGSFRAAGATWVLSFASDEPARSPFGPQDHAYIRVLSTLMATHLNQPPT